MQLQRLVLRENQAIPFIVYDGAEFREEISAKDPMYGAARNCHQHHDATRTNSIPFYLGSIQPRIMFRSRTTRNAMINHLTSQP